MSNYKGNPYGCSIFLEKGATDDGSRKDNKGNNINSKKKERFRRGINI